MHVYKYYRCRVYTQRNDRVLKKGDVYLCKRDKKNDLGSHGDLRRRRLQGMRKGGPIKLKKMEMAEMVGK